MSIIVNLVLIAILIICIALYIIYAKNKVDIISFKESIDLANLPIITFYIDKNKYNFLLDTGASISLINKKIIKDLPHTSNGASSVLFGMEGNPVTVECVNITLYYKDNMYIDTFQVVDLEAAFTNVKNNYGVTLHGVVGSLFFQKYKYILDFNKLIAYSKYK